MNQNEQKKKLCKSKEDKILCGVCGDLVKYLNMDSIREEVDISG